MPSSSARRTAARRSVSAEAAPHPVPPTAQAPNPRRGPEVKKRSGGPTSVRAPGRICTAPLSVAGGHQLRRLDDLGTMTTGHELLHLDDLHTASFTGKESRGRPLGQSYGLPSHPSTSNSHPSNDLHSC